MSQSSNMVCIVPAQGMNMLYVKRKEKKQYL